MIEGQLKETLGKRYKEGDIVDVLVIDRPAGEVRIRRKKGRQSFVVELKYVLILDGPWHKGSGKVKK